jgi:hypothetical protein
MPKKQKTPKDGLGPGTFVRFDRETREWLAAKAKTDDRSMSSMLRKIVSDAKLTDSTVEREPATSAA